MKITSDATAEQLILKPHTGEVNREMPPVIHGYKTLKEVK